MSENLRADKWLWQARFFKSRSLATKFLSSGGVRINGNPVRKSSQLVHPGDILTFAAGENMKVVKVVALGTRRGPVIEARGLYEDMSEPPTNAAPKGGANLSSAAAIRDSGAGRPTKAQRRAIDRLMGR